MEASVPTLNWHLSGQMNFCVSGFPIHIIPNAEAIAFKWVLAREDCWGALGSRILLLPPLLPCVERRGSGIFVPSLAGGELSAWWSGLFWALRCQSKSAANLIPVPAESLLNSYDEICTKLVVRNLRSTLRISAVYLFSNFGMTS